MEGLFATKHALSVDGGSYITSKLKYDSNGNITGYSSKCLLCADSVYTCSTTTIETDYRENHKREFNHVRRVQKTNMALKRYMDRSKEVYELLPDTLGFVAAEDLHEQMLFYLMDVDADEREPLTSKKLKFTVGQFNWTSKLVILELALWKMACILYPPKPLKEVSTVMLWMAYGWKANKERMRRHELITVVMENVVPFLGKPPP